MQIILGDVWQRERERERERERVGSAEEVQIILGDVWEGERERKSVGMGVCICVRERVCV